jgi:hypothetical protein
MSTKWICGPYVELPSLGFGFETPPPRVAGVLAVDAGGVILIDLKESWSALRSEEQGTVVADGEAAAAVSLRPGLRAVEDVDIDMGISPQGAWNVGPDGHGRSPGKDTAKGFAKKFSANEKVMPWVSSIGSSRGPGED